MEDVTDHEEISRRLVARRAALLVDLENLTRPPTEGSTVNFGKRIGDGTAEAVERLATTATARSIAASIADIDRVLAKIDDGSYGSCDRCGNPIPIERLEARPTSSLCVSCAGSAAPPT